MLKGLVIVALLVLPLSASATTYYVDNCVTVGNDSNNGTSTAKPWLTIAHVNAQSFKPGDTILFRSTCLWREQLVPPSSGSLGSPITFGAYGSGAQPILDGASVVTGWTLRSDSIYSTPVSWGPYGFSVFEDDVFLSKKPSIAAMIPGSYYESAKTLYVWTKNGDNPSGHTMEVSHYSTGENDGLISIRSKSYLTINSLEIEKSNWYGVYMQIATNITIENSTFSQTYQNAISPNELGRYANSSDVNTLNNTFSYCGYSRVSSGEEGVAINYLGIQNGIVSGNSISYEYGEGIVVNGGASNITISSNYVKSDPYAGIYVSSGYGLGGDTTNITVQYNYVYLGTVSYVIATEGPSGANINGVNFYYNVGDGGGSTCTYSLRFGGSDGAGVYENVNVYGNTLIGCTDVIVVNGSSGSGNTFVNNILDAGRYYAWVQRDPSTSNYSISHDDVYTPYNSAIEWLGTGYTLAGFQAAYPILMRNSVSGNPRLNSDYTLQSNSPDIHAGENLGTSCDLALDPYTTFPWGTMSQNADGSGWEIGAFVFAPQNRPAAPTSLSVTVLR